MAQQSWIRWESGGFSRRALVAMGDTVGLDATRVPCVLVLHGAGASASWTRDETEFNRVADSAGIIVVYPDALPINPARPGKFQTNPPLWNDGGAAEFIGQPVADDVAALDGLLDLLIRSYPIDPRWVCMSGFSNGAAMTFRYAAARAERLAAIAPLAGYCRIPNPRPSRPLPTLFIVGDRDPLVPLHGGPVRSPWTDEMQERPAVAQTLRLWANAIHASVEPQIHEPIPGLVVQDFPALPGGAELRAIIVEGLGHHWPGGRGRLSITIGGPINSRLNATHAIWQFFSHALRK